MYTFIGVYGYISLRIPDSSDEINHVHGNQLGRKKPVYCQLIRRRFLIWYTGRYNACKAWFFAVKKPPFIESYSQLKISSWSADFPTTCGADEHSQPLRAAIASSQLFSAVRSSEHQHLYVTCSQHWKHSLQIRAINTYFKNTLFVSKGKHSPAIWQVRLWVQAEWFAPACYNTSSH